MKITLNYLEHNRKRGFSSEEEFHPELQQGIGPEQEPIIDR